MTDLTVNCACCGVDLTGQQLVMQRVASDLFRPICYRCLHQGFTPSNPVRTTRAALAEIHDLLLDGSVGDTKEAHNNAARICSAALVKTKS